MKRVAYTIVFPEIILNMLNELGKKKGVPKQEVIRRALALYSKVEGYDSKNRKWVSSPPKEITIERQDGSLEDIVF